MWVSKKKYNMLEKKVENIESFLRLMPLWKETMYVCDPKKNTQCPKTRCVHNPGFAIYGHAACAYTSKIEYSIDGKPVELTK